jgi:hypothetical protein
VALTPYGSYEFALEDIDGRILGVGHIREERTFFNTDG